MVSSVPPFWARLPLIGNLGFPIAQKEIRALVRRNRFFWAQLGYLLVLGSGMMIISWGHNVAGTTPENTGRYLFHGFFALQNLPRPQARVRSIFMSGSSRSGFPKGLVRDDTGGDYRGACSHCQRRDPLPTP